MRQVVYEHGAIVHHEPKVTTELYLSNLDQRVSKGTAEVFFTRESDALAALRRCNQMKLYGKTLQIELVGTRLVAPAPTEIPKFSII